MARVIELSYHPVKGCAGTSARNAPSRRPRSKRRRSGTMPGSWSCRRRSDESPAGMGKGVGVPPGTAGQERLKKGLLCSK